MGFDSISSFQGHGPAAATRATSGVPNRSAQRGVDRARFATDVNQLELRLAIIDDRFERLASRPDDVYRAFRRDTLTRVREIAVRAHALETAGQIGANERRRVAALLVTLRARVVALDARHEAHGDRRRLHGGVAG